MNKVLMDQVGFLPASAKKAVLNFNAPEFKVVDEGGNTVFEGKTVHFGTDEISGEDTYVADFSGLTKAGSYKVVAGDVTGVSFSVGDDVFDKLRKATITFAAEQLLIRSMRACTITSHVISARQPYMARTQNLLMYPVDGTMQETTADIQLPVQLL